MTSSTLTPQPTPSSPHAFMAARQDSQEEDKARKGGPGAHDHDHDHDREPGKPKSTDGDGPSVVSDVEPKIYTNPGPG